MPAGHVRKIRIVDLGDAQYSLAGAGVMNGMYEYRAGHLIVVKPQDKRMVKLDWRWDGKKLLLVSEPTPPPTGSSYVGAEMSRLAN